MADVSASVPSGRGRALIAMSGGVDSSVAAACMQRDGYECIGITMQLYDNATVYGDGTQTECDRGANGRTCCSLDDTEDAKRVCETLGIDHYTANFREAFGECVIRKFTDSYSRGITPNPCIDCNRYLKFDRLMKRAQELGCDTVVTGHYARVIYNPGTGEYELRKGLDPAKDQSYVLYMLSQEQLSHIRFPIGELTKDETRRIADEYGFVNSNKPDSQDICFIPDGDTRGFLRRQGVECEPGSFVTENGEFLGEHTGICDYTIGQRKGLGIPAQHPWYVKKIDPEMNEIILSDNDSLFGRELEAVDVCWTYADARPAFDEIRCKARIRYHHREADAVVYITKNSGTDAQAGESVKVVFDEPQRAITPGQAVVFYDGDRVLGGGTII